MRYAITVRVWPVRTVDGLSFVPGSTRDQQHHVARCGQVESAPPAERNRNTHGSVSVSKAVMTVMFGRRPGQDVIAVPRDFMPAASSRTSRTARTPDLAPRQAARESRTACRFPGPGRRAPDERG
jgi:hypothetical protein